MVVNEQNADRRHHVIVAAYVGRAQIQMTRLRYVICTCPC
jgi:hypothetical protein